MLLRRPLGVVLALVLTGACAGGGGSAEQPSAQLAFGVQMAQQGLWNEALFRFRQAERTDAANPRVLNNLAVAYEAVGEFDQALEYYKKALGADPTNRELKRNYARFVEFYQSFRPQQPGAAGAAPAAAPASDAADAPDSPDAGAPPDATPPGVTPPVPEPPITEPPPGEPAPPPGDPTSPPSDPSSPPGAAATPPGGRPGGSAP